MAILLESPPPATQRLVRRLVIVRRDAIALYEELRAKFGDDAETKIIFDRRRQLRPVMTAERRRSLDAAILHSRGFYVQRLLTRRT